MQILLEVHLSLFNKIQSFLCYQFGNHSFINLWIDIVPKWVFEVWFWFLLYLLLKHHLQYNLIPLLHSRLRYFFFVFWFFFCLDLFSYVTTVLRFLFTCIHCFEFDFLFSLLLFFSSCCCFFLYSILTHSFLFTSAVSLELLF